MIYNVWIEIRDDFAFPADDPLDDDELQAKNRVTLETAVDVDVVRSLFKTRTQGPRSWKIYSLMYDLPDDKELERAVERFKSENPGQTNVMGAWHYEGNMVGCTLVETEEPNPDYVGEPYDIPNPAYQPDPELDDYDPRLTIRNPAWVPETITVRSQTGVPLYPVPGNLSNHMPDVDGVPDPTLRDVNVLYGQPLRVFS